MALKVLIRRDTIQNWATSCFIPRPYELVAAYDENSNDVIYKLGDGITPWDKLERITELNQLDRFYVYCSNGSKSAVENYLNPFLIKDVIADSNCS